MLSGDGSAVVGFAQRLSLVVELFATGEGYFELCITGRAEEEGCRHEGCTRILQCLGEFAYFAALEEQLARAATALPSIGSELVGGDIHIVDPNLALFDRAIGIREAHFAFAARLNLTACQDDACRVAIGEEVVERCTLVVGEQSAGRGLRFHRAKACRA